MARGPRTTSQEQDPAGGRPRSPGAGRRKRARLGTGALVALAVGASAVLMIALTGQVIQSRASCASAPVLNVAVSTDIAPAVGQVAQAFNREGRVGAGHCVQVQVASAPSATIAQRLDGQGSGAGQAAVSAWIPDSSLWVDVVRSYPRGASAIQPTGTEVAESPLMTVMPMAVAKETGAFDSPAGWNVLLPAGMGGPPASMGMKVLIPDPSDSAAGLATLVQLSRLLGTGPSARAAFTQFVLSSDATTQFGNSTSLASFVATAARPWDSRSVTVTTEQAVLAYDRANPAQPLAAQYPTGLQAKLGTEALDYPYVLTTSDPVLKAAAQQFQQALRQAYARSVLRFDGFRTPDGVGDAALASFGLQSQVLQQAATATASEAQTNLEVWGKLTQGTQLLVLIDTSRSMGLPDGSGTQTLEQETSQTSVLGLALFPDSTKIGLWDITDSAGPGGRPYQPLVSIGGLPDELGLITRRQQLQQIDETLHPSGQPLRLNDAILDGYKAATAAYRPNYGNALVVLTAGVDDGPGDMPTAALVAQLRKLFNPQRGIQIIIDQIGTAGRFAQLQQIATVTGGAAYEVRTSADIGQIFAASFSHRLCDPRCAPAP